MTTDDAVAARLARAGCVTAVDEAVALRRAAGDDGRLLEALVRRREAGEPLAWIVGWTELAGVRVNVAPGVYVPRPHTAVLAERAVHHLPPHGVAVDLCTGCGAVAAVLAHGRPHARVVAGDIDPAAVACTRANGIEAHRADLFAGLPADIAGSVDVVTAVPPYVPDDAVPFLPRDVQAWEPTRALRGGPDGLEVVRRIVDGAPRWLRPGGRLLVELGGAQADVVARIAESAGLIADALLRDEDGDVRGVDLRFDS